MRSQAHTFLIRVWRHYLPAKIDEFVNPILGKKRKRKGTSPEQWHCGRSKNMHVHSVQSLP